MTNQSAFDLSQSDIFKNTLARAISCVNEICRDAGRSPVGFTVSTVYEDWHEVSTSDLVVIIDEFASTFGRYTTPMYEHCANLMCDAINEHFSAENHKANYASRAQDS